MPSKVIDGDLESRLLGSDFGVYGPVEGKTCQDGEVGEVTAGVCGVVLLRS